VSELLELAGQHRADVEVEADRLLHGVEVDALNGEQQAAVDGLGQVLEQLRAAEQVDVRGDPLLQVEH
jgi:hypothetical protein